METVTHYLDLISWLLLVIGVAWFIFLAFKCSKSIVRKIVWAIVLIFFQPISGAVFCLLKKNAIVPLCFVIAGIVLRAIVFVFSVGSIYG
jgi:hypothetical protein